MWRALLHHLYTHRVSSDPYSIHNYLSIYQNFTIAFCFCFISSSHHTLLYSTLHTRTHTRAHARTHTQTHARTHTHTHKFTKYYYIFTDLRVKNYGLMLTHTYTHTHTHIRSYTGTLVCNDPERKIVTILLTNRCYEDNSERSKQLIHLNRRLFNDAVVKALG